MGIRPKDCLNYEFLYFYLTSLKEKKIKLQGQQGTQSNLNAGMVKEFELDLPSIREQQKSPPSCPLLMLKSPRWRKTRLPER